MDACAALSDYEDRSALADCIGQLDGWIEERRACQDLGAMQCEAALRAFAVWDVCVSGLSEDTVLPGPQCRIALHTWAVHFQGDINGLDINEVAPYDETLHALAALFTDVAADVAESVEEVDERFATTNDGEPLAPAEVTPSGTPETLAGQGEWHVEVPKSSIAAGIAPAVDFLGLMEVGSVGLAFPTDPKIAQTSRVDEMSMAEAELIAEKPPSAAWKATSAAICGALGVAALASIAAVIAFPSTATGWAAIGTTGGAIGACMAAYDAWTDQGRYVCHGAHTVTWGGPGGNSAFKNHNLGVVDPLLDVTSASEQGGSTSLSFDWAEGGTYEAGLRKCREARAAALTAAHEEAKTYKPTAGGGSGDIAVRVAPVALANITALHPVADVLDHVGRHVGKIAVPTPVANVSISPAVLIWDCPDGCPAVLELAVSSCGTGAIGTEEAAVTYDFLGDPACFSMTVSVAGQPVVSDLNLPLILRGDFEGEGNGSTSNAAD